MIYLFFFYQFFLAHKPIFVIPSNGMYINDSVVAELAFWSQKMLNVLKRMQKQFFFNIFVQSKFQKFLELTDFSTNIFDEKFGMTPILLATKSNIRIFMRIVRKLYINVKNVIEEKHFIIVFYIWIYFQKHQDPIYAKL